MLAENRWRMFIVVLVVCGAVAFVRAAPGQQSPITEIIDRSWLAATEFQQYPGTYAYPEHPAVAGAYLPPMTAPYHVPEKSGDVVVHTPYHFLVYLPQGYGEPARKWPLIVLLPDRTAANGNPALLAEEYLLRYVREQALPFMVLIPQCPELELWQADAVKTCIDEVAAGYAVDANRIYATGYGCKGGFGLWALAVKYPNLFAAVAPISGIAPISGNSYHERDANLVGVPVWIFAGADDTTVPAACLQREAASLRAAGVNGKLTVFPGVGHNAWSAAYRQRPLYDWFLKHSRAVAANARPRVAEEVDPHSMIVRAPEIVQWPHGKQAAATMTFDDRLACHAAVVAPMLEEYGWRGTFFVLPFGEMTWDQLRGMAAKGHEIGNHYGDGRNEAWDTTLPNSRDTIDRELPMQRCVSHAFGGGDFTSVRVAARNFVSARRVLGLEQAEPGDMYTLHCWFTDGWTRDRYDAAFDLALAYRGWALMGQHDVTAENFRPQLESIKARQERLWIAPQRDVVAYIRERRFASVHVVRQYEQTASLSVTCGLPGDLYHFPLTLAVPLPSGWVHATAMQNNKLVWQQWHDESRMLYLDAVPNGGDVVLRSD